MKRKIRFIFKICVGLIILNFFTWLLYGNFQKSKIMAERASKFLLWENVYAEQVAQIDTVDIIDLVHGYNKKNVIHLFKTTLIKGKEITVKDITKDLDYDYTINHPGFIFGYKDYIPMYLNCTIGIFAGRDSAGFIWKGIWLFFKWVTIQEYMDWVA